MDDTALNFDQYPLRGLLIDGVWHYAVVDIIKILTDTPDPAGYWRKMKHRAKTEGFEETLKQLKTARLKAPDNRLRDTDMANRPTLLRLIQSVPSPRAEPIRRWLAEIGEEKLQQAEDRRSDVERLRADYRARGYDDKWIDQRLEADANRNKLTDEWIYRGASGPEFAILTNVIHQGTFAISIAQHKKIKRLPRNANLRDHMERVELALTSLGEATAAMYHDQRDSQGYDELYQDAHDAGEDAGEARRAIERRSGRPVVSSKNFLKRPKQLPQQLNLFDNPDDPKEEP
jgi:DNA-damage-inducible protein D